MAVFDGQRRNLLLVVAAAFASVARRAAREPQAQLPLDGSERLALRLRHAEVRVRHDERARGAQRPERLVAHVPTARLHHAEAQRVVPEHQRGYAHVSHVGREYLGVDDVRHHAQAQRERDHEQRQAEHGQQSGAAVLGELLRAAGVQAPAHGEQRRGRQQVRADHEELAAVPFNHARREHGREHLDRAHHYSAHGRRQVAPALLEYVHRVREHDVDAAQLRARLEHEPDHQRLDGGPLDVRCATGAVGLGLAYLGRLGFHLGLHLGGIGAFAPEPHQLGLRSRLVALPEQVNGRLGRVVPRDHKQHADRQPGHVQPRVVHERAHHEHVQHAQIVREHEQRS